MSGQVLVATPDLVSPLSHTSVVPLSVAARDPFAHPIGETALGSHPVQRRSIEGRVAATYEAPACPVAISTPSPASMSSGTAPSASGAPNPADVAASEQLRAWAASQAAITQSTAPGDFSQLLLLMVV